MKQTQGLGVFVLAMSACLQLDSSRYVFSAPDAGADQLSCSHACSTPPARRCASEKSLEAFSSYGTCSEHLGCAYTPVLVECSSRCENGACVDEPCAGVFCDTPPAPRCDDATHLRVSQNAVCDRGACSYTTLAVDCPSGCTDGVCAGNTCAGISCTMAPAPVCIGSNLLRVSNDTGACSNGVCHYASHDVTCSGQCSNGTCVNDPCATVTCRTPPADFCLTGTSLRTFATSGTCESSGTCVFASTDSACLEGQVCSGGKCLTPSPVCTSVTCSDGCCTGDTCVHLGAEDDSHCGLAANVCSGCGSGFRCTSGSCADIDECATNHGGCDVRATCTNTSGGRTCTCPSGTVGDGLSCSAVDAGTPCTCGVGACTATSDSCATCVPLPASAESCNGIDDDCDGVIDNGWPLTSDENCGRCGHRCDAGSHCVDQVCAAR